MSTAELISALRALPPRERARVARAIMPATDSAVRAEDTATGRVTWPDLTAWKRKIYGDRLLPNLVLIEREETRW